VEALSTDTATAEERDAFLNDAGYHYNSLIAKTAPNTRTIGKIVKTGMANPNADYYVRAGDYLVKVDGEIQQSCNLLTLIDRYKNQD
jgi:hypothetical protein